MACSFRKSTLRAPRDYFRFARNPPGTQKSGNLVSALFGDRVGDDDADWTRVLTPLNAESRRQHPRKGLSPWETLAG